MESVEDTQLLQLREQPEGTSLASTLELSGRVFASTSDLFTQLQLWHQELPAEEYNDLLDDAATQVAEAGTNRVQQVESVFSDLFELAMETRTDFSKYRQTTRFRHIWGPLEAAQKNRQKNESKRERAKIIIRRAWGDQSEQFLQFKDSFQWVQKVSRLAKAAPRFDDAMILVNRAMYNRRQSVRRGVSTKLIPGNTDIENALRLARDGDKIEALTAMELQALGPGFEMRIGKSGVLEYGHSPSNPIIMEEENDNHHSEAQESVDVEGSNSAVAPIQAPFPQEDDQSPAFMRDVPAVGGQAGHFVPPVQNESPSISGMGTVQAHIQDRHFIPVQKQDGLSSRVAPALDPETNSRATPKIPQSSATMTAPENSGQQSQQQRSALACTVGHGTPILQENNRSSDMMSDAPSANTAQTGHFVSPVQNELPSISSTGTAQACGLDHPLPAAPTLSTPENEQSSATVTSPESSSQQSQPQPFATATMTAPRDPNQKSDQPPPAPHSTGQSDATSAPSPATIPGSDRALSDPPLGHSPMNEDYDQASDIDSLGCICVTNEFISLSTMLQIDQYPTTYRTGYDRDAFQLVYNHRQHFQEVHREHVLKGRELLCEKHVYQLAKLIGLSVDKSDYGVIVKRLAYIGSKASNYEDFKNIVCSYCTYCWFRRGREPPLGDSGRPNPFPYCVDAIQTPEQWIEVMENRVSAHGYGILCRLLGVCGARDIDPTSSFQSHGFIDLPIFSWIFDKDPASGLSIVDIAAGEFALQQSHLENAERVGNSESSLVLNHQYGLVQQLIEQDPLFYVLNVLLRPNGDKTITMVSYPQPAIYINNNTPEDQFTFASNPDRPNVANDDPLQAILPLTTETPDSCQHLLTGILSESDLADFLTQYERVAAQEWTQIPEFGPGYQLDRDLLNRVAKESSGRFKIVSRAIQEGSIRLFSGNMAVANSGNSPRVAFQPLLIPLSISGLDATLPNGMMLKDLKRCRKAAKPIVSNPFGARYQGETIRPWIMSEPLPGISPLSAAIQLQRSFYNSSVLAEISILLSDDTDSIANYITRWRETARANLITRFQLLEHTIQTASPTIPDVQNPTLGDDEMIGGIEN